ncbi:pectin lyase fold/virulence factor [Sphaerosporella brunnea]|uniref:Pectin lyase fold/virulence factor n=1 Tax=Sphaerosporella brunnea TaxID=1250544 RepID=A0A5J5EFJ2_9PEZI|nr:pectin lyase fold/virulence factor [Sphaerosporella brunnea]
MVTSLDALVSATADDTARIVYISGTVSGDAVVKVGSNKSILGKDSSASLEGVGLRILKKSNVIIRNIQISKVLGKTCWNFWTGGTASNYAWVDHVDLSFDRDHDKDYFDGLLDITHGSDYVAVSFSHLHDHWKCSLVGHSDSSTVEDTGNLTVTYSHNYFENINSRAPSYRFGTGHIFNNYFESVSDGINTRDGAQLLVENNVFEDVKKPLYSTDDGYAVASGNAGNILTPG